MESIVRNIEKTSAKSVILHMNSVSKIKVVKTHDVSIISTMTGAQNGMKEDVKTKNANARMVRQQTSITVQLMGSYIVQAVMMVFIKLQQQTNVGQMYATVNTEQQKQD